MSGFDYEEGYEEYGRGSEAHEPPGFFTTYRFWAMATAVAAVVVWTSCGDDELNVFRPMAAPVALKGNNDAKLEEARVDLDNQKFEAALSILSPMVDSENNDSNRARLYYAAAKLGQSELDVWSVVEKILDQTTAQQSSNKKSGKKSGGIDEILNDFSDSLLGTGTARAAKIAALADAVKTLAGAPDPAAKAVRNTACLFAGFLAVPTLADAQSGLTATLAALNQIQTAASSGGTVCPNITALDTASASLVTASENFSLVLDAAKTCPFIDLEQTQALMNTVETTLASLKANVDLGCDNVPSCPAAAPNCQQLFPPCVQEALKVGASDAVAGDGKIAACELILHCTDPSTCLGLK